MLEYSSVFSGLTGFPGFPEKVIFSAWRELLILEYDDAIPVYSELPVYTPRPFSMKDSRQCVQVFLFKEILLLNLHHSLG